MCSAYVDCWLMSCKEMVAEKRRTAWGFLKFCPSGSFYLIFMGILAFKVQKLCRFWHSSTFWIFQSAPPPFMTEKVVYWKSAWCFCFLYFSFVALWRHSSHFFFIMQGFGFNSVIKAFVFVDTCQKCPRRSGKAYVDGLSGFFCYCFQGLKSAHFRSSISHCGTKQQNCWAQQREESGLQGTAHLKPTSHNIAARRRSILLFSTKNYICFLYCFLKSWNVLILFCLSCNSLSMLVWYPETKNL